MFFGVGTIDLIWPGGGGRRWLGRVVPYRTLRVEGVFDVQEGEIVNSIHIFIYLSDFFLCLGTRKDHHYRHHHLLYYPLDRWMCCFNHLAMYTSPVDFL